MPPSKHVQGGASSYADGKFTMADAPEEIEVKTSNDTGTQGAPIFWADVKDAAADVVVEGKTADGATAAAVLRLSQPVFNAETKTLTFKAEAGAAPKLSGGKVAASGAAAPTGPISMTSATIYADAYNPGEDAGGAKHGVVGAVVGYNVGQAICGPGWGCGIAGAHMGAHGGYYHYGK